MFKNPFKSFENKPSPDILKPQFKASKEDTERWKKQFMNLGHPEEEAKKLAIKKAAEIQEIASINLQKHEETKIASGAEKRIEELLTPPIPSQKQPPSIERQAGQ